MGDRPIETGRSGRHGLLLLAFVLGGCSGHCFTIQGIVVDGQDPVAGARVRLRAGEQLLITDAAGHFSFDNLPTDDPVVLTAWAPGYFIVALEDVSPGGDPVQLELVALDDHDHLDYTWVSAFAAAGQENNCENCHSDASGLLPFEEWQSDAHARTLENPRFLTMYTGTDLQGNRSPPTRFFSSRDYGRAPLPPDTREPYYGPGYKLDFPSSQGNCSACHAPAAAINAPYGVDPTQVEGVGKEGITCDFCHKIWDVRLSEPGGLPRANMPGVLSYAYRRPAEGHQFFAGPFDDVAPGDDTYSPIQTESVYCAPCHFGFFWETLVYNSYGEWLASPYSDPDSGKTCQDCHMPPRGTKLFATPAAGGQERDPERIASHRMLGATDEAFMRAAATLEVEAEWAMDALALEVRVTNDNTGHKLPTDSPLRNVILVVRAFDAAGRSLDLLDGPRLPDWTGSGAGRSGHYAGQPGRAYALILEEQWTGVSPTGAYWNPVRILSDSRLPPCEVDVSRYRFERPADGSATFAVHLLFRRAFIELQEQKGWTDADLLLSERTLELSPEDSARPSRRFGFRPSGPRSGSQRPQAPCGI